MLSIKQGSIKYYFLSFWYDLIRDWTPVYRAIGEPNPADETTKADMG